MQTAKSLEKHFSNGFNVLHGGKEKIHFFFAIPSYLSWLVNLPPLTYPPPPRNKALLRVYYPLVSLNKALIRLTGHESTSKPKFKLTSCNLLESRCFKFLHFNSSLLKNTYLEQVTHKDHNVHAQTNKLNICSSKVIFQPHLNQLLVTRYTIYFRMVIYALTTHCITFYLRF